MACITQQQEADGSSPGRQVDKDGLTTMSCTSSEDCHISRPIGAALIRAGSGRQEEQTPTWDSDAELGLCPSLQQVSDSGRRDVN